MFAEELSVNRGQKKSLEARKSRERARASAKKKQDYIDKCNREREQANLIGAVNAEQGSAGSAIDDDREESPSILPAEPSASIAQASSGASSASSASSASNAAATASMERRQLREERAKNRRWKAAITAVQSSFRMRLSYRATLAFLRRDYDRKVRVFCAFPPFSSIFTITI